MTFGCIILIHNQLRNLKLILSYLDKLSCTYDKIVVIDDNSDIDIVTQGAMFTDFYKEILMDEVEKLTEKRIMLYKINDSSRLGAALLI